MIGGMPLGAGPLGASSFTPAPVYAEASAGVTQAAAGAMAMARVRPTTAAASQAAAVSAVGARIAQGAAGAVQDVDLFLDGVMLDAGGFVFDMAQRATVVMRGAAIRTGGAYVAQSDNVTLMGVRVLAAQAAAVQGITTQFRAVKLAVASAAITPSAILNVPAAAIRAGRLTAVGQAAVEFMASLLIDSLPEYAMTRPAEGRGMRRPAENRSMRVAPR